MPLSALRPTNSSAERRKFMAALDSGKPYSPRFNYASNLKAQAELDKYHRRLSEEHLELAWRIVRGVISEYGSENGYQEAVWGECMEKSEVEEAIASYREREGLDEAILQFKWSTKTLVTNCSTTKRGTGLVTLVASKGYYRSVRFSSLLDHEVGTHFIRAHNQRLLAAKPSRKGQQTSGWLLATEEGLACLNTHRTYSDPRLWMPALLYVAAVLASRLSFWELWKQLEEYVTDRDRLWIIVVRVKRGCRDTAQAGGFYKDLCNFDGAVRLLSARESIDWVGMHAIKVSLEDHQRMLPTAHQNLKNARLRLPTFLDNQEQYTAAMDRIATANGIDVLHNPDSLEPIDIQAAPSEGQGEETDSDGDDEDLI